MGKFKDRLDRLDSLSINNSTNSTKCEPGRTVDFKTKIPGGGGEEGGKGKGGESICDCIDSDTEQVIDELRNLYPFGPSFNTGKLFTQASTPVEIDSGITSPSPDPKIIGFYDETLVAPKRNNINARQIWVIADPDGSVNPNDPFLYVKTSTGANSTFSVEVPVRVGEDWEFRNVYSFRIRSSLAGQQYRITTDPHRTTFVSVVQNIPGSSSAAIGNKPNFLTLNLGVGMVDSVLPSILVPNGFALALRSSVTNAFGSQLFISNTDATIAADRVTLFPGDVITLNINNANVIHVAGDQAGLTIDISVEQL